MSEEQTNNEEQEQQKNDPFKMRLFANKEEKYRVVRPSVKAFEEIRKLALRSSKIPLARKFDICKELGKDWRVALNIENRKSLDKLLDNIETDDPARLGEKVLNARGIKERFDDNTLNGFQVARRAVPFLFEDENGNAPSVSEKSIDDLLIGNIEKAMGLLFQQINISEDEYLADRSTFKAFASHENSFPLAPVSVANVKELSKLQMKVLSIPEKDRREICNEMVWSFEKETPDIKDSVSKADYWRRAAAIILKGVELTDENKDYIDAGEMNRALAVFFARSDGLF